MWCADLHRICVFQNFDSLSSTSWKISYEGWEHGRAVRTSDTRKWLNTWRNEKLNPPPPTLWPRRGVGGEEGRSTRWRRAQRSATEKEEDWMRYVPWLLSIIWVCALTEEMSKFLDVMYKLHLNSKSIQVYLVEIFAHRCTGITDKHMKTAT